MTTNKKIYILENIILLSLCVSGFILATLQGMRTVALIAGGAFGLLLALFILFLYDEVRVAKLIFIHAAGVFLFVHVLNHFFFNNTTQHNTTQR